ncbi:hypothetical protein [Inediibacterium massiliense]|uniref:hypothetical protein n=1 Tax=Inediibacterium massiliense TaxID=1658111 RepID=UPI0006B46351|nr:hypothetical protein [Inediibacterium massiliense]
MRPEELKIIRKFKAKKMEIENFMMEEMNDLISEYVDKKMYERYKITQNLADEIVDSLEKINSWETVTLYADEYFKRFDLLDKHVIDTKNYMDTSSTLSQEILALRKDELKQKIDGLYEFVAMAQYCQFGKTANNLLFQIKKTFNNIAHLLNEIVAEVISPYKDSMNKILEDMNSKISAKTEEMKNYIKIKDSKDEKLKKITDCRRMDLLLNNLGYEPIRQGKTSHKIYSNGQKSIPVPQHASLNKNLAYEIQKQALKKCMF